MTLPDFLLARADEDEQLADSRLGRVGDLLGLSLGRRSVEQVLAQCEAIRLVVREYQGHVARGPLRPDDEESVKSHRGIVDALETSMRALALPYADHPDFKPAWKP